MLPELSKTYEPASIQGPITKKWLDHKAFAAHPDARAERYVIMMPLPNVTGALHMGHAMDNVMQDLLTRWHRMRGDNALWQPGTDHAGIGTQAVVEKRLFELEKKTRHDLGREGLVRRIWEWKDQYQARIIQQQQQMGCSCDWDRQRFTMDPVCARAVRHWFFRMFRDGLIYRGNRLVNWDCFLQTAVADDETYHEKVRGHFWHLRYPVLNARAGEPKFVVVATTRPETMLADTAVAVHPDPAAALARAIADTRTRLAEAPAKEKPAAGGLRCRWWSARCRSSWRSGPSPNSAAAVSRSRTATTPTTTRCGSGTRTSRGPQSRGEGDRHGSWQLRAALKSTNSTRHRLLGPTAGWCHGGALP